MLKVSKNIETDRRRKVNQIICKKIETENVQATIETEKHIFQLKMTVAVKNVKNVEQLLISIKDVLKQSHPDLVDSSSVDFPTFAKR